MTRRRRGRPPGPPSAGAPVGRAADDDRQPRVGPDGRPDDRRDGYTPPPSPLTRWQHHNTRAGGNPNVPRPRWAGSSAPPRSERRSAPPAPQGRPRDGRPPAGRPAAPRPNDARVPPRQNAARPAPAATAAQGTIDAFELFCAYHLGITPEDGYRIQNIHEVARRFGTNAGELRQILADLGMAADDIVHSGFDLPSAQVDIMVAPMGISRRELARPLYDEFRSAPKQARNWAREMEEAQRQIEETIGRDGRWSPGRRDPAGKQS